MTLLHPRAMTEASIDPLTANRCSETRTPGEPTQTDAETAPFPGDIESLLEETASAVVVFDRDFRYLFVNAEAERLIGRDSSELMGNAMWRLFPEEVAPYWEVLTRAQRERTAATLTPEDPGSELWAEARCLPVAYRGEADCLAVCFRRNLRQRETEQEALRILCGVADGFVSLDPGGRIVFANPRTAVLLTSPHRNLARRGVLDAWPALKNTRFEFEYERLCRTGEPGAFEMTFDSGLWLETHLYPSAHGGSFVTFRDITERKVREADARRLLSEAVDRANRDPLTGLLNHRAFYERLHTEIARAVDL